MKIENIAIRGFRCFDDGGETFSLDDLTCLVGPNASGKTAAMMALVRMFGEYQAIRQIIPTDFHHAVGENIKAKPSRTLTIECRLVFPEFECDGKDLGEAVPETFNQMVVDAPGGTPYCRIRLEAEWTNDGTPSGDIKQTLSWILTSSDDPKIIDDGNRRRVQPGDRAKIRVVYIPATRDPDHQIKTTTTNSFGRLLDALNWDGVDETLKVTLAGLQSQLSELPGINTMNTQVQSAWRGLYDGHVARQVTFQALEQDPAILIKHLVPTFRPGEDGHAMISSDLSDGLRSLFSLSLSLGLFKVEELLRDPKVESGFNADLGNELPFFTVFAVEEPENHLSPHYLGRVVTELVNIAGHDRAQIVLSSHSPSILSRIKPDYVRYFLGHERTKKTQIKNIPLPADDTEEEFKYVREAVRGFPELYFARLVILGEGPSEEIVLKRLFEASGTPLDTHFVSVVPLGGRHVNHFWRLLEGLGIPFLTLLDLDREKEGAGWGRIQYVRDQLVQRFGEGHESLKFETDKGKFHSLEEKAYDELSKHPDNDTKLMNSWIDFFADSFGVFFSAPLDLDFALLEAFPDNYKGLAPAPQGPRLPHKDAPEYKDAIDHRMKQVLASDVSKVPASTGSTYTDAQKELFAWYKYLFVDGSKPVNHMRALLTIDDKTLVEKAPDVLKQLVAKARESVIPADGIE